MEFNKEELYWIERTSDIECVMCLNKFAEICSIAKANLNEKELKQLNKYTDELIKTYTILKTLRAKLEENRK
jgi:hypothetical protein